MSSFLSRFTLDKMGIPNFKKHSNTKDKLSMELIKYSKIDSVKVIDLPDEAYEEVDLTKLEDNEVYKQTYEFFCKKLKEIVPKEDLNNFYRNFSDIKMKKLSLIVSYSRFFSSGGTIDGMYDPRDNSISLKNGILSKIVGTHTHELLHAASTYYDHEKGIIYCGLSQAYISKEEGKPNEIYGMALNEGFTQYFNDKYFVDHDNLTFNILGEDHTIEAKNTIAGKMIYKEEQMIAKALCTIVGEDKMMSFYFRGDLNGLIKELEQYAPRETIYQFINFTDTLCYYSAKKNAANEELKEVKTFINSFLIRLYMKAKGNEVDGKALEDFIRNCIPYKDSLKNSVALEEKYLQGEMVDFSSDEEKEEQGMKK